MSTHDPAHDRVESPAGNGNPPEPHGGAGAAPLDGLGAMLGGLDLGSLFGAATEMLAAQQASADTEVMGRAGGGAVQIRVTGGGEFLGVRIAAELVDPQDVSLLEDTLLAALRDAMDQIQQLQHGALGGLGGMGGLDALAGVSDLLGSAGLAGPRGGLDPPQAPDPDGTSGERQP
ncbi:MAG: YbaB/EbfC family nucleoid-associated protein [Acidimicrobiales bacterium]